MRGPSRFANAAITIGGRFSAIGFPFLVCRRNATRRSSSTSSQVRRAASLSRGPQ